MMNKFMSTFFLLVLTGAVYAAESMEWSLDKSHTTVGFSIRHMGIANVRGQFNHYEGGIHFDGEAIESLALQATIDAASVDTNNKGRDDHLRNEDFFHVSEFPSIVFVSHAVVAHNGGHALKGELTIKDVTKAVVLPLTVNGPITDPWGNQRMGVELRGTIDRRAFGVGFDGATDRLIGGTVQFDIQIEAIKQ